MQTSGRGRQALAAAASAAFVGAALAAMAHVASRTPAVRVLDGLPGFRDVMTALPIGEAVSVPPLRQEFLEHVLGPDLGLFVNRGSAPAPGGAGRGPGFQAPSDNPPPSPETNAGLQIPVPSFSDLDVAMTADRREVEPGGVITYAITVTNIGSKGFQGELTIQAHHPFWTTDATSQCGDAGLDPGPDDPCIAPAAPVPGTGAEQVHTVQFSYNGPISRGGSIIRTFRVRVNPATPSGTIIVNHAHLDVVGDDEPAEVSSEPEVVVR